jgi:hypothetical protein
VADILEKARDDVGLVMVTWRAVLDPGDQAALGEVIASLHRIGRKLQGLPEPVPGGRDGAGPGGASGACGS